MACGRQARRNLGVTLKFGKIAKLAKLARSWAYKAKARAMPGLSPRRDKPSAKTPCGIDQATLLKALLMPLLIGSAVSVATFCASAPSSLPCSV